MPKPPESSTLQHHGWLLARLRRKLGCAWDAADIAQSTFVRVLAASGSTNWPSRATASAAVCCLASPASAHEKPGACTGLIAHPGDGNLRACCPWERARRLGG